MQKDERTARARALVNDELFSMAFDEIGAGIIKEMTLSDNPNECWDRKVELEGLRRAFNRLKVWAAEKTDN